MILVLIIISIFKALFKLAFVLLIVAIVAVAVFGVSPKEMVDKGKALVTESREFVVDKIIPIVESGLQNAKVAKGENGETTISGKGYNFTVNSQGKVSLKIDSLNVNIKQEELEKYLSKEQFQRLMEQIDEAIKQASP